jgi:DNA polymerase III subunit gamma/tau
LISYLQSSLRYRPQKFSEVLGQRPVITVLQNSIRYGKLSSSYLFAGQHGTGKTSVARIFSKVLNCESGTKPVLDACCLCDSCLNITQCKDPNVVELDAASHGGKDDIKELKDIVAQLPYPGKKKIVILDEVQSMTNQAQQAFLKLLEEPPKDVIFILATTDPQKLLDTVRSRCFRLDFKGLSRSDVEVSIRRIFDESGVKYDSSVIRMLLNNSDGSLRDLQQVADQIVSMYDGSSAITDKTVSELMGYLSIDQYKELAYLLCSKDFRTWVEGVQDFFESGVDLEYVISRSLQDLIRDFRCSLCCGTDWDYISGIPYESFKKNMKFSEVEIDILQQSLEDTMISRNQGCPSRMALEIFYMRFLDEVRQISGDRDG